MSTQIDTALVQQYRDNIELKFQQTTPRLQMAMRNEMITGEYGFFDRITPTAAIERTTRHGDTPQIDTPHDRRRVGLRDFEWADLIDDQDKLRMLADPTSGYVQNAVAALNRAKDDVVVDAFDATVATGKTGTGTASFSSDSEIAVNYVETGVATSSNMTIGKLRRALYLLESQEAHEAKKYVVWGPSQKQALLRTTEVTSADYNTVKALVNGEINTFMGFEFILSNRLDVASSIRDCYAFTTNGMCFVSAENLTIRVSERDDKSYSTQVYVRGTFNAVRMWEEAVLRIKCDETA